MKNRFLIYIAVTLIFAFVYTLFFHLTGLRNNYWLTQSGILFVWFITSLILKNRETKNIYPSILIRSLAFVIPAIAGFIFLLLSTPQKVPATLNGAEYNLAFIYADYYSMWFFFYLIVVWILTILFFKFREKQTIGTSNNFEKKAVGDWHILKRLNHPIKRTMFICFALTAFVLGVMTFTSPPIKFGTYTSWEKKPKEVLNKKTIITVGRSCAENFVPALDMLIASGYTTTEGSYYFDADRIKKIEGFLLARKYFCDEERCTSKLTLDTFNKILEQCGKSETLYENRRTSWDATNSAETWFKTLLFLIGFLFSSLLYDFTIGPIVGWLRKLLKWVSKG